MAWASVPWGRGICPGLKMQGRSFSQNVSAPIQMAKAITPSDVRLALGSLCLSFPLLLIFHSSSLNKLCGIIALNFDQRKLVHRRICFTLKIDENFPYFISSAFGFNSWMGVGVLCVETVQLPLGIRCR